MTIKITLLTIIVSVLGVVSIYFVLEDFRYQKLEVSDSLLDSKQANVRYPDAVSRGAEAAYILPVIESNYLPLRDWSILEPDIQARAAAIFDTHSGKILFQKNIKTHLPVASITKLLTAMIVLENTNPNSKIFITEEAMNVDDEGGADFFLNEVFFASDLLKVMLVKSSNDAAAAFKLFLNDKNVDLVQTINEKAEEIGMLNSKFYDVSGLDDNGYSTAEDVIKLLNISLKYPEIQGALLTKYIDINSADGKFVHNIDNTNDLLEIIPDIQGGKTGYTDGALGTMVLKVNLPPHKTSLVGVVLGAYDRFGEMKKMIDWAKEAHKWE